jgi:hypothetical protein
MDRIESQSPKATNATEATTEATTATKRREPIKSTPRDVAGFGVQLGVLGRDIANAEIEGPITPAQRAAIEEMAAGLARLSVLCAEHFGVSDHFGGEDL